MSQGELRKDYLQEKYVLIAPQKAGRPHDVERCEVLNAVQSRRSCHFCPHKVDNKKDLLTIGPKDNWHVKVMPAAHPAVTTTNAHAYGMQEEVIETRSHILQLEDLPEEHITKVFEAYDRRMREISKDGNIHYILMHKHQGGKAAPSAGHAHSSIFASAFLPPHLADKSQRALAYRLEHGSCVYCDVVAKEAEGPRLVWQDDAVIAFAPYASFTNYELWIMPKRHVDNITLVDAGERASMAWILKRALHAIGDLHLPYSFYFHQVIRDTDQHFYLKLAPAGNVWSGVNLASGLAINPVKPETAAAYYRDRLKKS